VVISRLAGEDANWDNCKNKAPEVKTRSSRRGRGQRASQKTRETTKGGNRRERFRNTGWTRTKKPTLLSRANRKLRLPEKSKKRLLKKPEPRKRGGSLTYPKKKTAKTWGIYKTGIIKGKMNGSSKKVAIVQPLRESGYGEVMYAKERDAV